MVEESNQRGRLGGGSTQQVYLSTKGRGLVRQETSARQQISLGHRVSMRNPAVHQGHWQADLNEGKTSEGSGVPISDVPGPLCRSKADRRIDEQLDRGQSQCDAAAAVPGET